VCYVISTGEGQTPVELSKAARQEGAILIDLANRRNKEKSQKNIKLS